MQGLSSGEQAFLLESTEREVMVRLEILDRVNRRVIRTIDTWLDDIPDDLQDADRLMIIGGNVRVDTSQDVLRTLSLELVDPNRECTVGVDGLIGLDKMFRVYKGYRVPTPWGTGGISLWPLGVFLLNGIPDVDASSGQRIIRFQGGDKACLGNGRPEGGFQTAYRVSQGAKKVDAIRDLASKWNETDFNITPDSSATVPYDRPFPSSGAPYLAAQTINQIVEPNGKITRLSFNATGALTLAFDPGPDLASLPPVWTAQPVTKGFSQLVGARRQPDLLSLCNAVRVNYGSSRGAPGTVLVKDENPNSPTSVTRIGHRIKEWKNGAQDDLIWTQAEALARANFELQQDLSYQEKAPITLLEQPALEPWDVIYVSAPLADMSGNYQLLSFTIDLGTSGTMQAEGWRIRKLA